MSKKKQKPSQRKTDPLNNVVRILHSTKNIKYGVSKARDTYASTPRLLFNFLYERPIFKGIIQHTLFPNKVEDLSLLPADHKHNDNNDLIWAALLCSKNADVLNQFITLRNSFENHLITGNYLEAETILDSVKEKFGYSLWYFDRKFQILQLNYGLATQKEYLSKILENKEINPIIGYFLFMLSMKSEPNVSLSYLEDLSDQLENRIKRIALLFKYLINPSSLSNRDNPYYLLYSAENGTLIDKYQILLATLQITAATDGSIPIPDTTIAALEAINAINDSSLATTRLIFNNTTIDDETIKDHTSLHAFDAYTEGRYQESSRLAAEILTNTPSDSNMLELLVRSNSFLDTPILPNAKKDSILITSINYMANIITMNGEIDQSITRLEKIFLSCNYTIFGLQILNYIRRSHTFDGDHSFSLLDRYWATASNYINPWHLELLERSTIQTNFRLKFTLINSSAFTLRRAFLNNDQKMIESLNIPNSRILNYKGKIALNEGRYQDARDAFIACSNNSPNLTATTARKYLYIVLLAQHDFVSAIDLVLNSYYKNNNSVFQYDLSLLVTKFPWKKASKEQKIRIANILSLANKYFDLQTESDLSNIFEDILTDYNCNRPTSIISVHNGSISDLIYFLNHVATIRIMEDSTKFESLDSIDTERIALCNWLSENDAESQKTYSNEIRAITRHAMIGKLHERVSDSKMYVDETGISQLISPYLEDDFKRHQVLLQHPDVNYNSQIIAKKMERLLESRDTLEGDKAASDFRKWKVPANERHSLLSVIYENFLDRFLFSPEFGLDSNISANVRHGTFVGQIRSPLAEHYLVTTRDKKTSTYEKNHKWLNKYKSFSDEELEDLNIALQRFSNRTDKLFNYINDELLHIKSDNKKLGLLDFTSNNNIAEQIGSSLNSDSQIDEFVRLLFDSAWQHTAETMEKVRDYLLYTMEPEIIKFFGLLESDISTTIPLSRIPELTDEIAKARIDIAAKIRTIIQWFKPPSRTDDDQFPFDIIVEVAEAEAKQCFGGRVINISKSLSVPELVRGRKIFGFIEIIFILLQNAISHCGEVSPDYLAINVDLIGKNLELVVSNTLSESVDIQERTKQVEDAIARYNQSGAVKHLRIEGGSGLSKIWRTAEYTLKTKHSASMNIQDGIFSTRISMTSEGIFV